MAWAWHSRNNVGSSLCQTGTGAMASTGRSHEVLTTVPAQARVEQDYEQSQRYEGRELAGKRWSGTWPWQQGCLSCYGLCVLFLCLGQPEAQRRTCPDHECLLSSAAHLETCSTLHKDTDPKISDQTKPPGWLYWASAAGNCLGDAMGMAQQARYLQIFVSNTHWCHDQYWEVNMKC